ncbi:MAG TPA: hypothetical protein VM163_14130 [bacterium]|nr:hypothetical protein [bacterium]
MKDKDIDKIAQAIAAKIGEPGGPVILGCGDASSSQDYRCSDTYICYDDYECGGAGVFNCGYGFYCHGYFDCEGASSQFNCGSDRFVCDTYSA